MLKKNDLLALDKLDALIEKLTKSKNERRDNLYLAACSAMKLANDNGDVQRLTNLFHAFADTENNAEFRYWVGKLSTTGVKWDKEQNKLAVPAKSKSHIAWDNEGEKFFQRKGDEFKVQGNINLDLALSHPWWEDAAVQQNRQALFDAEKDVQSAYQFISNHVKKARKAADNEEMSADDRQKAKALADFYSDILAKFPKKGDGEKEVLAPEKVLTKGKPLDAGKGEGEALQERPH